MRRCECGQYPDVCACYGHAGEDGISRWGRGGVRWRTTPDEPLRGLEGHTEGSQVHYAQVTKFHVSLLPEDESGNHIVWGLDVEYRGHNTWAVVHLNRCLSKTGEWDYEPLPSSRDDEFLEQHRFTLEDAMGLAWKRVGDLVINDLRVVNGKLRPA